MQVRILGGVTLCLLALGARAQSVYPTGTTIWDPASTSDGYTIFAERTGSVVLIDMDGTVVKTWTSTTPGNVLSTIKPLDNGRILALEGRPTRTRRTVVELDYANNLVWKYKLPAKVPAATEFHHDIERLPNGNTLILSRQDARVPSVSHELIKDDCLLEVDALGNVVWMWETWKHFDEFEFNALQKELIDLQGGDWAHANSSSVIPPNNHADPALAEGNVIVSYRFTNTICIVDRQTGAIVWRSGPDEAHLTHGQHFPHMIELGLPGAGNILVFDNGSGTGYAPRRRAPGQSRVIEIDPTTKQIVWQYTDGKRFWSDIISGAQRLPNGNTLICSGVKGRLFEVDPSGVIVWEYMSPFGSPDGLGTNRSIYRAYRVPYSWAP